MEAHDAITKAKKYFAELFSDERITEAGLEEVEFDEVRDVWRVTIGFSRVSYPLNRWYKVVTFQDEDGKFVSIKNRETATS